MKAKKNAKTGKWDIQFRYTDASGKRVKTTKRGFNKQRDAEEWYREFMLTKANDFNMKLSSFVALYYEDCQARFKENTMSPKKYIIDLKILSYFGDVKISDITPAMVREWQTSLLNQGYSQTYLKTINNQLSAIFNYAVRVHGLKSNPCRNAGSIGKSKADEMDFYTQEEFNQFIDALRNKWESYMCFMILYWTGMRMGELLALTYGDIDLENNTIRINKSLQRLHGQTLITTPKTPKSKRVVHIPEKLKEELKEYMEHHKVFNANADTRIFTVSKGFLQHEAERGAKEAGLRKIRIHDFRHSHVALLIEMGIPILAISERLGHEKIETTLNVYGHLYPNKQKELAESLNEKFMEVN